MSDARTASHYPVFLDVRERLCVIVGSDAAALRKARSLAALGADVVVIEPHATEELLLLQSDGVATVEQRGYVRGDLDGAFLVHCASGSGEVGRAIHSEAQERGCLINIADAPELCSFIVPSVIRRGGLQVAISTGGVAPGAARRLKRMLGDELGDEWTDYVALLGEVRALAIVSDPGEVDAILGRAADSDLLDRLRAGACPSAAGLLEEFAHPDHDDEADQTPAGGDEGL